MSSDLATALVLAAAIGAVAQTVSSTEITKDLRAEVVKRSLWFGKLLACPYCLSHWLAFAATLCYRPYLVNARRDFAPLVVLDFLVTAMAMVSLAMAAVWLIRLALNKSGTGQQSSSPFDRR